MRVIEMSPTWPKPSSRTSTICAAPARPTSLDAGILTDLTGRTIRRVVADDDEWTAAMIGRGVPADQANMLLGMFHAARRAEFATTGPELEKLLQGPATSVRSILEGLTT